MFILIVTDLSMSHKTEDKLPPHSRFVPRQKPRRHGSKWLLGSAPSSLQKHGKADESDMPSCLRELPLRLLCHDTLELERRAEINSIDLNLFPQRFSSHWEERKLKHCLFIYWHFVFQKLDTDICLALLINFWEVLFFFKEKISSAFQRTRVYGTK